MLISATNVGSICAGSTPTLLLKASIVSPHGHMTASVPSSSKRTLPSWTG